MLLVEGKSVAEKECWAEDVVPAAHKIQVLKSAEIIHSNGLFWVQKPHVRVSVCVMCFV